MWTEATIKKLLDTNDKAVMRALVAIYKRQTDDEKMRGSTHSANGRGFNLYDAQFCSELAIQVMNGRGLSPKQMGVARNKIKRYHRQLLEIARETEARKAAREFVNQPAVDME